MNTTRRSSHSTSRLLALWTAALCGLSWAFPAPIAGQDAPPESSWRVILLPQVDLWYHGLATIGFGGLGPDPLYDADYSERAAAAKRAAGAYPTTLDDRAAEFGGELGADQTFEVFHFVPLYFASSNVEPMLSALDQVGASSGTPAVDDMLAQFGASAVAATVPGEDQRQVLSEWSGTLRVEWEGFFADYWRERAIAAGPYIQAVQSEWDERFAPRLAGYLAAWNLNDGILVLSDPVGPEGRIFEGDPANPSDNIVVVGFDDAANPRAPLFAAVREMCFPVVREVLAAQPVVPDRAAAATRSSRAAVRCGADLLDQVAPELALEYRSALVTDADGSPADLTAAFEQKYPIDAGIGAAIQEKLGAIPGP